MEQQTRRLTIIVDVPHYAVKALLLDLSQAARRRGAQIVQPVEDEPAPGKGNEEVSDVVENR